MWTTFKFDKIFKNIFSIERLRWLHLNEVNKKVTVCSPGLNKSLQLWIVSILGTIWWREGNHFLIFFESLYVLAFRRKPWIRIEKRHVLASKQSFSFDDIYNSFRGTRFFIWGKRNISKCPSLIFINMQVSRLQLY